MSDTEKNLEQSDVPERNVEKIDDLPNKQITDKDATAVNGGADLSAGINFKISPRSSGGP